MTLKEVANPKEGPPIQWACCKRDNNGEQQASVTVSQRESLHVPLVLCRPPSQVEGLYCLSPERRAGKSRPREQHHLQRLEAVMSQHRALSPLPSLLGICFIWKHSGVCRHLGMEHFGNQPSRRPALAAPPMTGEKLMASWEVGSSSQPRPVASQAGGSCIIPALVLIPSRCFCSLI